VNQPKRKWVKKDNSTTSSKAVDNGRTSIKVQLNPINNEIKPSIKPLKHQKSIQNNVRKAGRR
jgi:hypothetical protein